MTVTHPIEPVFDERSEILILGSFPSVRSRETAFFYGHSQNRFWQVLAAVKRAQIPQTVEEKREFLLREHIAVWDVVARCEIAGSADGSIKNAVPNDIFRILNAAPIRAVFTNGKTADRLYDRFFGGVVFLPKTCLPSTSPANAAFTAQRLIEAWRAIRM